MHYHCASLASIRIEEYQTMETSHYYLGQVGPCFLSFCLSWQLPQYARGFISLSDNISVSNPHSDKVDI